MIKKALIPMAGLGTRMGALARAVPKTLFPLVDSQGSLRPIVHYTIQEALSAGATSVGLVVSPAHVDLLRKYFAAIRKTADGGEWVDALQYIIQPSPQGFGEAVARGADFIGDEPFLLLLGDHIYKPSAGAAACGLQVTAAFEEYKPSAMIGVQEVSEDQIGLVGVCAGRQIQGRTLKCTAIVEKPGVETARRSLSSEGVPEGKYLAHSGIYVFGPEIFESLARLAVADRPMGQELQLTDAQIMLLQQQPDRYLLHIIDGRAYDTGNPQLYLGAQQALLEN